MVRGATELAPLELLDRTQAIEHRLGRVRSGRRWGPRAIDLDILLYGGEVVSHPRLTIPHLHIRERGFVLRPLADLAPGRSIPPEGSQIGELLTIVNADDVLQVEGPELGRLNVVDRLGGELEALEIVLHLQQRPAGPEDQRRDHQHEQRGGHGDRRVAPARERAQEQQQLQRHGAHHDRPGQTCAFHSGELTGVARLSADTLRGVSDVLPHEREAEAEREAATDPLAPRTVYLHRRVVKIAPERIEIRPPRSAVIAPALGVAVTAGLLALLGTSVDSLPFWSLPIILLVSVLLLPLSGLSLVYALIGAHIVASGPGNNVSLKQRFLGLGIGTNEMIPFWKIRELLIEDEGRPVARADVDLPSQEVAQWQLILVKKSGTRHTLGSVNVPREHEEEGLELIMDVADAFAALSDAPIRGPIW